MEFFGLEKLSLVDYDGKVAATVFTGTCNFRCGFCHNGPLVIGVNELEPLPTESIFDYLNSRKGILEGLCISGGEPTLQKDLPSFMEKVKNLGYSVKLDTNGTNPEMIKSLVNNGLCDYFAMDIKNDKENYAKIIGFDKFDTKNVEKSVEFFLSGKTDYEFRTTLISEFHKKENIIKIGEWIKGAKKYMLQKFKETDGCIAHGLHGIDDKTAKEYVEILSPFIQNVNLRGY